MRMRFSSFPNMRWNTDENAKPMDTTPIPSGEPVRFVLEIPGGRSAELGLEAGASLEHSRVEAEAAE